MGDDSDDTHHAINRVISTLKTAGIGDDVLASEMMARAIFHFRVAGWTDDEIVPRP